MSNHRRLQSFNARARRPYSWMIAAAAAIAMLSGTAVPRNVWAGGPPIFTPNNLVVSRGVYAGTASTITIGETLPPGCTAGPVMVPLLIGGMVSVTIPSGPSGCNTSPGALYNGTYPFVFNNDAADSHFGITAPIFLDQLTTGGTLLNTLPIDPSQIDTSFSSKSELAVNRSVDGQSVTFMGYVAGAGFTTGPNVLDISNGSTPGLVDPTNPAVSQYYRSVAEVDAFGNVQITKGNAYSGDNGRAAMKGGNELYYMSGNDNQGNLSKTQLTAIVNGTTNPVVSVNLWKNNLGDISASHAVNK